MQVLKRSGEACVFTLGGGFRLRETPGPRRRGGDAAGKKREVLTNVSRKRNKVPCDSACPVRPIRPELGILPHRGIGKDAPRCVVHSEDPFLVRRQQQQQFGFGSGGMESCLVRIGGATIFVVQCICSVQFVQQKCKRFKFALCFFGGKVVYISELEGLSCHKHSLTAGKQKRN